MSRVFRAVQIRVIMISITILAASVASAGDWNVSLTQAEELALHNNSRITMATDSVAGATARTSQARANLLPRIGANGTYTRFLDLPKFYFAGIGEIESQDTTSITYGLSVSQPLFLGFAGISGLRMAKTAVENSRLQQHAVTDDVVKSVRESYFAAVLNRALVDVASEAVAQAESILALVERQYGVGAASRFDLIRAQVQVATSRPVHVTAVSNQELSDAALRTAIGLPTQDVVIPTDTLARFESRWLDVSLDSLRGVARWNRTDLRLLQNAASIAGNAVSLARSQYYPQIAAFGQSNWQEIGPDVWDRTAAVGVQVSWNVFDSFGTPARVQEAKVGRRQIESITRLTHQGMALQVEAAQRKLTEAWVNMRSLDETVSLARESYRLASVLFASGGSTQLDVIGAQLALTQSRTQRETALFQYHIAHTQMEHALGLIRTAPRFSQSR
jgi:outer membrane protein